MKNAPFYMYNDVFVVRQRQRLITAFTVFSKKHRAAVERQQPNCDRRTVRKVTADWWHALAVNEKLRYHEMASKVGYCTNNNAKYIIFGTLYIVVQITIALLTRSLYV